MDARVNKRYANALYELAKDVNATDRVYADMKMLVDNLFSDRQIRLFLSNPSTPASFKKKVLTEALEGKIDAITLKFLNFIVEKNRGINIYLISKVYIYMYRRKNGILKATVSTAIALDDVDTEYFRKYISEKCNCVVEVKNKVIPKLIGGFILKIDGLYIDKSVRNGLNQIKMQVNENVYTKN